MKFTFDIIPTVVPKRHYFWNLIGAGISATASHINSLYNANQNRKLQQASMRWQTSEREAQQQYQTSERNLQNNWSEQMYKNYSSPQAMARQYAEAGLNPRLAADGSSVGSPTSGGGSNGGAPSGQSAPTPPYMPVDGLASGFGSMASAFKALAEAKKAGVETSGYEKMIEKELRGKQLENDSKEFINTFILPLERDGKVFDNKSKEQELRKLIVDIANGELQGQEIKERIYSLGLDNKIKQNDLDHWLESYNANLEKTKSESDLNRSYANRNMVQNALDVQKIQESKELQRVAKFTADKLHLDFKLMSDNFDALSNEIKYRADNQKNLSNQTLIKFYDDLYGLCMYIASGQHEVPADVKQQLTHIMHTRKEASSTFEWALENIDLINGINEALGVSASTQSEEDFDATELTSHPNASRFHSTSKY